MRFHSQHLPAWIWIPVAVLNVVLSFDRYVRHDRHDGFALVQAVFWLLMLGFWISLATTRWIFTDTALLQRRIGFRQRSIPYARITSVDPPPAGRNREAAVIVYGNEDPMTPVQRITVQPEHFADFLAALECRATHAAFHV